MNIDRNAGIAALRRTGNRGFPRVQEADPMKPRRKVRRGRPLKADAAPDMQERILDAAEDHFSRHTVSGG